MATAHAEAADKKFEAADKKFEAADKKVEDADKKVEDAIEKWSNAEEGPVKDVYLSRMNSAMEDNDSARADRDAARADRDAAMPLNAGTIIQIRNQFSQNGWEPRQPPSMWKQRKLFDREDIVDCFKTYVSGVKSPAESPQRKLVSCSSGKGLEICTTVGIMGMGKTVCQG